MDTVPKDGMLVNATHATHVYVVVNGQGVVVAVEKIAASPELLQLLKEWVSEAEDGSLSNGDRRLIRDDNIARTHAAILKAEGKS